LQRGSVLIPFVQAMTQHMSIRAGAERQQGHRRRLVRSPFAWTHLARGTLVLKLGAMIRNRTPQIKSDFHDGRMIAFRARQRVVLRLVLRVVLPPRLASSHPADPSTDGIDSGLPLSRASLVSATLSIKLRSEVDSLGRRSVPLPVSIGCHVNVKIRHWLGHPRRVLIRLK
jgi:hypothetical protein